MKHTSIVSLTLLLAPFSAALAQDVAPTGTQVQIVIDGQQRGLLRLAFPRAERLDPMTAAGSAAASDLEAVLRSDLQLAGVFSVQGPTELAALQLTGDASRDAELYRSLGNEVLLTAEIKQEDDRMVLEGRVFDLASGEFILGKRYRAELGMVHRIAHSFTDEVVLYFTGRPGIALTTIAFSSNRSGDKEIYLMDWDGRSQRPITGHKSISMAPDWSAKGDSIAYVSFFEGGPGIYLVELPSGAKRPVVNDGTFTASPSLAPDSSRVAFARSVDGNSEIFVANRDGSNLTRLTRSNGIDTNPAFSPDGASIAFTSSRSGSPHVYVMQSDGSNLRRISFEGEYNDGAAWSPDGRRLAYASRGKSGQFAIVVTDLATLETKVIHSGGGSHEAPTFSPDGRFLAFTSTITSGSSKTTQIFVTDSQGGGTPRQLTTVGDNLAPSWSPRPSE
jgi:TolB protein